MCCTMCVVAQPTTGLSPETRREIWSIIEKRKRRSRSAMKPGELGRGKSIILTTHSMEEVSTSCQKRVARVL